MQYLRITQPCEFCVRTKKRCVAADPRNAKSPCTSCRRAKTKCSWIPPISRKHTEHSEPPGCDDATSSPETPLNPLPPVNENAVAGPSTVSDPQPSINNSSLIEFLAYHNDVTKAIDGYTTFCEAVLSSLQEKIVPLEVKMNEAEQQMAKLVDLFSDV